MIPHMAEILPRSVAGGEATSIGKGILLPLDQTGNHFLGIKGLSKPLNGGHGEVRDQWSYMTHLTTARYPFEPLLSPFGRGGMVGGRDGYGAFDFSVISGARRKNATRETTSPLKVWLHEHRKNPYPTKGEKIMLAILTKMTLTQISTWFANARRRLKKDNKMTWSPRNKSADKRDSVSKTSKYPSGGDVNHSVSSNEDDESMQIDEIDNRPFGNEESNLTDACLSDDVFSEDGRKEDEQNVWIKNDKVERSIKTEVTGPLSSKLSPDSLLKKIDFAGNSSPVGNLQRWVDGHFGNQSPVDFPKELTPPRTPVEDVMFPGLYGARDSLKNKENSCNVKQGAGSAKGLQDLVCKNDKDTAGNEAGKLEERLEAATTQDSDALKVSSPSAEELATSLAPGEFGLQKKFRSCGLTSHKEIDAVLALTSLASR